MSKIHSMEAKVEHEILARRVRKIGGKLTSNASKPTAAERLAALQLRVQARAQASDGEACSHDNADSGRQHGPLDSVCALGCVGAACGAGATHSESALPTRVRCHGDDAAPDVNAYTCNALALGCDGSGCSDVGYAGSGHAEDFG